jgi:hypothetical protein
MAQLYEVILYQEYYGQEVVNRWNYYTADTLLAPNGAIILAGAMGLGAAPFTSAPAGTVGKELTDIQASVLIYKSLSSRAIYDPLDFYEIGFPASNTPPPGGAGTDPFTAYGFRTNRVRQDIGRAYKRFAGVQPALTTEGGGINGTGLGRMVELGAAMSEDLSGIVEGVTVTFKPCVVQKQKPASPPVPGFLSPRYYPTLEEQVEHMGLGIAFTPYNVVRSQTSRQRGRGS